MYHSSRPVHRNLFLLCFGALLLTLSGCQGYQNFYWYVCKSTGYYTPFCTRPPASETHLFPEQPVPSPSSNQFSPERKLLGEKLFFDPILSRDQTVSCATCHQPHHAYADPNQFSTGIGGQTGSRNSISLLNAAYQRHVFFDGRTGSLEQQAREPMFNSLEMGNLRCRLNKDENEEKHDCVPIQQEDLDDKMRDAIQRGDIIVRDKVEVVTDRLKGNHEYRELFKNAFDHDIQAASPKETFTLILQAIASFERTLTSTDSLFDQWVKEEAPISWKAQRGWRLFFGKARCSLCHIPPTYSDGDFHNLGVPRVIKQDGEEVEDKGRASFLDQHPQSQAPGEFLQPLRPPTYEIRQEQVGQAEVRPKQERQSDRREKVHNFWEPFGMDACAYKTPSLRNVEHTDPYMHTGAFKRLEDVVRFYVNGGGKTPCGEKDWRIQKLDLDSTEQGYIVEFLKTLSGTKVPPGVPPPTLE